LDLEEEKELRMQLVAENIIRMNLGDRIGTMCLLHRLAEGILPSQLDQINAHPKGNWY